MLSLLVRYFCRLPPQEAYKVLTWLALLQVWVNFSHESALCFQYLIQKGWKFKEDHWWSRIGGTIPVWVQSFFSICACSLWPNFGRNCLLWKWRKGDAQHFFELSGCPAMDIMLMYIYKRGFHLLNPLDKTWLMKSAYDPEIMRQNKRKAKEPISVRSDKF